MVIVIGYPSYLGGADTELWHVLRLWRRFGLDPALIPTWHAPADWRSRCDAIGVPTIEVGSPERLADVPGLRGATVVSFCNGEFLKHADVFRQLGCRIVWVGCMTWLFPAEREHYARCGPFDAYVFQSDFQRAKLLPELRQLGVRDEQCFTIRGAFDADEFDFAPRPHEPNSDFVIGRLARPHADKWSSNTWPIYGAVPYARRRARLMGVNERVAQKLGPKPDWAEVLAPCAEPTRDFFASLHCLVSINGGAAENWPRVGLEAMAVGVPVIAENQWGWREMIEHGRTGYLANDDHEFAYYAATLAMHEDARLQIARNARAALIEELAKPDDLWKRWRALYDYVGSRKVFGSVRGTTSTHSGPFSPSEMKPLAGAEAAWRAHAAADLATMTLRDVFDRGFAAGYRNGADGRAAGTTQSAAAGASPTM